MYVNPDKWLIDRLSENFIQLHRIEEVLYSGKTRYQSIKFIRTASLGLSLVLDNKIQSCELDEFVYHEALVQPAMLAHPHPESIFIAGGGEGATLREALFHKSVKRAVMVDIDAEVVSLCRKYLPNHSRGSFEDKRTELYHTDARAFLEKSKDKFDVVVIDLPDPIEGGPAYLLYTQEFYKIVQKRLTSDGIISVQAGSAQLNDLLQLSVVYNTLKSVFPVVSTFKVDTPCYGGPWGFCTASQILDPLQLSPAEIDSRISARSLNFKSYDGVAHHGMFCLPKYLRDALAEQKRLITDKEPLYMYESRQPTAD